jgi:hypothetical protein
MPNSEAKQKLLELAAKIKNDDGRHDLVEEIETVIKMWETQDDRLAEIRIQREKFYGNPAFNMDTTAMMLTGLIENHFQIRLPHTIPGHVWALALVAMKLNRAAFALNEDNYDDAINYLRIAAERQRAQAGGSLPSDGIDSDRNNSQRSDPEA